MNLRHPWLNFHKPDVFINSRHGASRELSTGYTHGVETLWLYAVTHGFENR